MDVDNDLHVVAVEANVVRGEADLLADAASNLLEVDLRLVDGHFTKKHDLKIVRQSPIKNHSKILGKSTYHAGFSRSLHGNLGVGVDLEAGVEDAIRHLIAELVGVALTNGLGGEVEMAVFVISSSLHLWNVNLL